MKWISIKDELPPISNFGDTIDVIGWDNVLEEYIHCYYWYGTYKEKGFFNYSDGNYNEDITYWFIPEKPNES